MYAGVYIYIFKNVKQEAFKYDAMNVTNENGNASTYSSTATNLAVTSSTTVGFGLQLEVTDTTVTATMTIISNLNAHMLEHTRTMEANQANVYEFQHVDDTMLGKLKKKLDAELHDAQEDENNAALEWLARSHLMM